MPNAKRPKSKALKPIQYATPPGAPDPLDAPDMALRHAPVRPGCREV
jgi:hypothetical protein